jgi:predicted oxidoreductase
MSVQFSSIAAGAWRMAYWDMTPQARLAWIEGCLDLGITTFDHADI